MHGCTKLVILIASLFFNLLLLGSAKAEIKIQFHIATFWDGHQINQDSLEVINRIRERFPQVQLLHFISPTYFLVKSTKRQNLKWFQKMIGPKDQVGIYLGSWKSIIDKANVFYRISPSFWAASTGTCTHNCGFSVPLNAYELDDLDQIITTSQRALARSGINLNSEIYSVAGWVDSPAIGRITAQKGYRFNFSPIPPTRIKYNLEDYPIYQWVNKNWAQFETIHSPRSSDHGIIFIPQNVGVADYTTPRSSLINFQSGVKDSNNSRNIAIYSIHARTAKTFAARISKSLEFIHNETRRQQVTLTFDWKSYRDSLIQNR